MFLKTFIVLNKRVMLKDKADVALLHGNVVNSLARG